MNMLRSALLLALASCALAARAGIYTFSGALTTASPIYAPGSGFDGRFYSQLLFQVDVTGLYDFNIASDYDNALLLFAGPTDPQNSSTNFLAFDDDSGPDLNAGLRYALTAGTTYGFVSTSIGQSTTGSFTSTIVGPGNVFPTSAVPAPAAAAGFAIGLVRRRKRA